MTGSPGDRPRGRPPRTSRAAIADAVIAAGFDRATTSEIAAHVGVDQSTLYGYVSNRAELLRLGADRAIEGIRWPSYDGADWRAYLHSCTEALWALYREYPGLARYIRSIPDVPADLAERGAEVARILVESVGLDTLTAAIAVDTLGDLAIDSFLNAERLGGTIVKEGPADEVAQQLRVARERLPDGAEYFEAVHFALQTDGSWWRDKVELVLDGIAFRLAR